MFNFLALMVCGDWMIIIVCFSCLARRSYLARQKLSRRIFTTNLSWVLTPVSICISKESALSNPLSLPPHLPRHLLWYMLVRVYYHVFMKEFNFLYSCDSINLCMFYSCKCTVYTGLFVYMFQF